MLAAWHCNLAMQGDRPPIFIRTNRLDDLDLARLSEEQRPRIFYLLGILKALNGFMRMIWSIAGQHPDSKAVFGGQTALTYITRGSGYSAKYKANRSMPVELGIYEVRRDNAGLRNKVVMSLMEKLAIEHGCEITEWNGEADHIHMQLRYPPTIVLSNTVGALKSKSGSAFLENSDPPTGENMNAPSGPVDSFSAPSEVQHWKS